MSWTFIVDRMWETMPEFKRISSAGANLGTKPVSKSASVTLRMLLHGIRDFIFIHKPRLSSKAFRWFASIPHKADISKEGYEDNLLFICKPDIAAMLIDQHRSSFFLVLTKEETSAEMIGKYGNRLIVAKCAKSYAYYERIVQNIFIEDFSWENEMDYVVYSRGRLERLIAASTHMLQNFLCITDTGFNLIMCSKDILPPNDKYKQLVENGCYDLDEIEYLERNVVAPARSGNSLIMCDIDEHHSHKSLHAPIFIDNAYVFHFTLVYPPGADDEVLTDIFKKFLSRAVSLTTEFWENKIVLQSSCHTMLIQLINGQKMNRSYINTQLSLAEIPTRSRFRLIHYRLDPRRAHSANKAITEAAEQLNNGLCHPFTYDNNLLVLCYTPIEQEAGISLNKIHKSADEIMFRPFGIQAGVSQSFTDIKDINLAFKQTKAALKLRALLAKSFPSGYQGDGRFPVFTFEHALPFLLFGDERDDDLIKLSLSRGILEILTEDDKAQNTDFVNMLWIYLCSERNASETAQQTHVHRNTVIYHIKKFEQRFDVSLDTYMVRNRLMFDFINHFKSAAEY